MGEKDDYLTSYRVFFENFAATVDPEDQLPVNIAGYTITESELPGEVIYWTTQYLTEKQCPLTLMIPLQRIILDEVQVAAKQYPYEFGFDEEESEYIALRLMQAVTARVNDICLRYLDNARLDTLPPPLPQPLRGFPTSASFTKNSRRAMEDRHFEIGNLEALFGIETTTPTSFYGVYDGHAGAAAATYCAAHLHQYLAESAHFTADLPRALHHAFLRTDTDFVRKSNQKRAGGGSTAVVVCVRARRLVAAWAGDSLALLAKRMRLMQIVHAHKPDRPDEKKRIEASGGKVMYWGTWRVNGQLAVSRAIGDAQYKPYVTAQPEIAVVDLDGDEDFVVVACDGLWDFVSEDVVALTVYKSLANDPNDLKAVTKNLLIQAKNEGSEDNISVIVVFLKDPREIAADNSPPMELGLDNAVVTAPPFSVENDDRKVDNVCVANENDVSDSDSDDLGPETAVDIDGDDVDPDSRPSEPAAPTPPAHAVEENQVDGNLVDNVAESGEDSEDEWNYYKGEREQNAGEEIDEAPRSETPGQDNSAWESSSVDMNSSPLNPDAPVFVPGGVAGSDLLLAESPRKPLSMDDIDLPEEAQFETEAHIRPAELDNCDQLNGHHNLSMEGVTEHLNGNSKNTMDSLGFGFNVGIEQDKIKDTSLIQDFERIQKDTTDFCNIQVFQAHETNPFSVEGNEELFERLKNKERDPMSMSFYQEKDDDTCERFAKPEACVDLNSVQPLPESDDEDIATNGVCPSFGEDEKENFNPESKETEVCNDEPNNDIVKQNIDNGEVMVNNFVDFNFDPSNNMQNYSQADFDSNLPQESVVQTDTPESHKLLFEQIPEIPDGKSSELGFNTEDVLEPESERDMRVATPQDEASQDVEMDSKSEDLHQEDNNEDQHLEEIESLSNKQFEDEQNEIVPEIENIGENNVEKSTLSPEPEDGHPNSISPEVNHENIIVDVHCNSETQQNEIFNDETKREAVESELVEEKVTDELLPSKSPIQSEIPLEDHELLPSKSPIQSEIPLEDHELFPSKSPIQSEIPLEDNELLPSKSPIQSEIPSEDHHLTSQSPSQTPQLPSYELLTSQVTESPIPSESPVPSKSPLPREASPLREASPACDSLLPTEPEVLQESLHRDSPSPCQPLAQDILQLSESPLLRESPLPSESPLPTERIPSQEEEDVLGSKSPLHHNIEPEIQNEPVSQLETLPIKEVSREPSPLPAEIPLPRESPIPSDSPVPEEPQVCNKIDDLSHENEVGQLILTNENSTVEQKTNLEDVQENIINENEQVQEIVEQKETIQIETEEICQRIDSPQVENALSEATERIIDVNVPSSPSPVQDGITSQTVELVASPVPARADSSPMDDLKSEVAPVDGSAPTPDIVPESRNRTELVTDIDIGIGIPESHAQEICVPVSSEIPQEEAAPSATPPPTPAVQPAPIAAAIAGTAAIAAVGAAVAVGAKAKTASPKKSPTAAPKSASKTAPKVGGSAPPRTPVSATKRPVTAAKSPAPAAARPAAPKTPASATKTTPAKSATKPAPPKLASSPAAPAMRAAAKPTAAAPPRAATASRPAAARPAPKPAAPRSAPTATKPSAPAAPKPAAPKPAAPAARPTPAPRAAARPAPARVPLSAAPPKPKETKPKAPEARKPLTNGDVKPAAKPAVPRAPAPRPPAQRPAPRVPSAAATTKPAAPKPPVRAPLDKQSKDLANKRITAKAAPPRTAPIKAPTASAPRPPIKKSVAAPALNGDAPHKPPPSPPAADNALLPDVIA